MPFNAVTYRINRDTRRAKDELTKAREAKRRGMPALVVADHVIRARTWWRFVKLERALRDLHPERH